MSQIMPLFFHFNIEWHKGNCWDVSISSSSYKVEKQIEMAA